MFLPADGGFRFCPLLFLFLLLYCSILLRSFASGFELALFASNGCYSHDVMIREVGEVFEAMLNNGTISYDTPKPSSTIEYNNSTISPSFNGTTVSSPPPLNGTTVSILSPSPHYRIHWVQLFMYDFDFGGPLPKPTRWNTLVVDSTKREQGKLARSLMEYGSRLMWYTTLPLDHNRPWDLRGALFLFEMLRWNQHQCEQFVVSQQFRQFLAEQRTDLVVIDHFLQECFTAAASLLRSPATIQFSNWPIADGYIASLNIPAPPSAYPKTSTSFSSKEMRFFFVRLRNAMFHAVISTVRTIQSYQIRHFFSSLGHSQVQLEGVESAHVFYAGRAEFFSEPVRPISNRIKHFGCAECRERRQYLIPIPSPREEYSNNKNNETNWEFVIPSRTIPTKFSCSNSSQIIKLNKCCKMHKRIGQINAGSMENEPKRQFPDLNWAELEQRPFVLVSFGSIAKVEFMPAQLLRLFLRAFSRFPDTVFVWQTNSRPESIADALLASEIEVPDNVRMHRWAPIKAILAHQNLRYAILHGGVNTVNEALIYAGKPILGLPLQGDQSSNLQRLVELGMAELVDIAGVWAGELETKMALLEGKKEYGEYARRARRVNAMIGHYRQQLGGGQQNFWLRWVANKRFLLKRSGNRFFGLFYRSSIEHFAIVELGTALALFVIFCVILSR